jgi:D-sedoheptulose 7-phosphate isomerase
MQMKDIITKAFEESVLLKQGFVKQYTDDLITAAQRLATCFAADHKLLIFGNGGSAADAQHIAAELVNRFSVERKPLPAVALSTDTSVLTSIANDYSYDEVFSKQIKALGKRDDIALGISTSGRSQNVIRAVETARDMGLYTLGLTGCGGGKLSPRCDLALIVDSESTPRIQETHSIIMHVLCDLVDRILFPDSFIKA